MRTVRFVCWLALLAGALFYQLDSANAQANAPASSDAQQACTPDAMRLCSDAVPDVAKVTACMKAKSSQLSPACRLAMHGGAGGSGEAGDHGEHHRRYRHCRHHCG
jgi:hypothetical protein